MIEPSVEKLVSDVYLWDVTEFFQGANHDDHDVFYFGRMDPGGVFILFLSI